MQEKTVSLYELGNEVHRISNLIAVYQEQLDSWLVPRREKRAIREKLPAVQKRFDEKLKQYEELLASSQSKEQKAQPV